MEYLTNKSLDDLGSRRRLERKFKRHIGLSPKQLGKVIRLQAAIKEFGLVYNDDTT